MSISLRTSWIMRAMPASPAAAAPNSVGRPKIANFAPRQRAMTMSEPRRTPLSRISSTSSPTAARIAGSTSSGDGAASS